MIANSSSKHNGASPSGKSERVYSQIARDLAWESSEADQFIKLEVISCSMLPMLKPGDKVIAQKIDPKSLRVGDIVVFRRAGEFITHRLVGRASRQWITKGDHWRHLDPSLSEVAILGKVTAIERDSTCINLQTKFWRTAGLVLGHIHWWQGWCFHFLRKHKAWIKRDN